MSTPHTKLAAGPRSDEAEGAATRASLDFVPLLCSAVALLCILFVSIALGTHEWIQGAVVHGGVPAEAYVGLSSVDVNGTSSHLAALCPKGTSHQVPASFTDTPPAVWCKCERAGTAGEWLIFLAYVPLWAACLFSAVEGLAATHPRAKAVKAKLSGMGVGQQLQQRALIGFWAAAWLCLFLGLLAYASLAPDTLGWGTVVFEASFNLARLAFLLVTIATALISAKLLGLWHEEAFGEALGDFLEARGARRALYFVLCGQLVRAGRARPPRRRPSRAPPPPVCLPWARALTSGCPCVRRPLSACAAHRAAALPVRVDREPGVAGADPALRALLPGQRQVQLFAALRDAHAHDFAL